MESRRPAQDKTNFAAPLQTSEGLESSSGQGGPSPVTHLLSWSWYLKRSPCLCPRRPSSTLLASLVTCTRPPPPTRSGETDLPSSDLSVWGRRLGTPVPTTTRRRPMKGSRAREGRGLRGTDSDHRRLWWENRVLLSRVPLRVSPVYGSPEFLIQESPLFQCSLLVHTLFALREYWSVVTKINSTLPSDEDRTVINQLK